MLNIDDILSLHSDFLRVIKDPNFSKPIYADCITISFSDPSALQICDKYGIAIEGSPGPENSIILDGSRKFLDIKVKFNDKKNILIFGRGVGFLTGYINFSQSDDGVVCFSGIGNQGVSNARIDLIGKNLLFFAGTGFTSVGSQSVLEGFEKSIIFGNDCMLSWDVFIRNYDSHPIFDLKEKNVINAPGSILVGSHVWIGQRAFIAKPCRIGHGAIVGASSIVTKDVPCISAVAGNPAKVVRSNISWSREASASFGNFFDLELLRHTDSQLFKI